MDAHESSRLDFCRDRHRSGSVTLYNSSIPLIVVSCIFLFSSVKHSDFQTHIVLISTYTKKTLLNRSLSSTVE